MESDTEKSIMKQRDCETRDQAQGSNVSTAAIFNSSSSNVKINSFSINLGIVKGKDDPQKCSHFSIRGYVAKMREKGGNHHLPFSEEVPPIEVPKFRYWLCQSCLRDSGGESNTCELVSESAKISMMQPCTNCHTKSSSAPDCDGLPVLLPFGEGTSGVKPVDERINGDESILAVIQEDTTESSPNNLTDKINTNMTEDATVVDDVEKVDLANEDLTDQQNEDQDPNGQNPRRKARKVRLLTELLCEKQQQMNQRKETKTKRKSTDLSPLKKRKDWRPVDDDHVAISTQDQARKKVKGDIAAVKTSSVVEGEGDKYHKPDKVNSDTVAAWRSIFNDMNGSESDKVNEALRPFSHDDHVSNSFISEKRPSQDAYKKVFMDNCSPMREDIHMHSVGDSRVRGTGLGLGLSLNYEPQSRVSWLPPLPLPNHSRKDGFFCGETSINGHKGRPVYNNVRDGHAFLQEQQHPFYTTHGSFSNHHNLDFSDPHNKRNNGYADVMMNHNHQRQDLFSNGRSDEREIAELMAKIQYERNLDEASRKYNISNYHKASNFNQGMPIPIPQHQYPTIRRPSLSPTMPSMDNSIFGPTTMRNSSGFFHQEPPVPSFPSFNTFSNGIRFSDNSQYHESRENNRVMEGFNNGRPGNVWSNMEMHTNWSNMNKGKKVMNLDLNVMAPNVFEEHNNNNIGDRSYSNEAIPAMQLLSLMDAGKTSTSSSSSSFMDNRKPFSCYNGISGMQSSVQKPVENPRNLILGGHGPSLPVTSSFSSFFQTDQTATQFFHKPQEKKDSGHKYYRTEDSFGIPFTWRTSEQGSLRPRNVPSETEICTINQNPADFSIPGPENVYMIDVENLKFRGDRVFYRREGTV